MANFNATPRRKPVLQAKHSKQDSEYATKYSCPKCRISYYAQKAMCPLCDATRQIHELKQIMTEMARQLEQTSNLNHRLKAQTDASIAIRDATDLLDENDLLFFKTVLYQWKLTKDVTLRLTHDGTLNLSTPSMRDLRPNGFLFLTKDEEPVAHECTSMGGLAIADYYEEVLQTAGSAVAMTLLVKGFAKLLPGAVT